MMKNIIKIIVIVTIIFSVLTPFVIIKPVNVFPHLTNNNGLSSSDVQYGGNSVNRVIVHDDNMIKYESHLKSKYKFPFSGYSLIFKEDPRDFRFRNLIQYKISATDSKVLRFNIGINVKGYGHFIYETDFPVSDKTKVIRLSTLHPADWWYSSNNVSKSDFPPPSLKNIDHFSIVNSSVSPLNVSEIVTVEEIKVKLSPFPFILISSVLLVLLIVNEVKEFKRKRISSPIYNEITLNESMDFEEAKVIKFIGENYSQAAISIEEVAENTGVSKYKIPDILKDRFDLTFPQYLNKIRIEEVKRLLVETDLSVLDISLSVGYNTVSHFNRTFKRVVGITPLAYRKEYKREK